ncbi:MULTISPECIES: hypothetical protein [Sorangium]|uniref:HNH nuclease domain-containing protein n=1 Tax=Sorangium cellulosum (strain So ce56) TaxID=448385 RepID=A9GD56_SORC5|nr:hypothetical protein [Sorangium cellulosum]CAN99312.1 hypothetical protein sce9139 [Sorangium cellulosum So ce56]
MIRVELLPEPTSFDEEVRAPGNAWLAQHPDAPPEAMPALWRPMTHLLADGFNHRCGYSAMWTPRGTVDHYLSRSTHPERTYDWDNYRFASGEMNSRKGTWNDRVLDPFEIEDGWFEILLPSLELVMVEELIPAEQRDRARFTLKTLRLQDDDGILEQRQSWYDEFLNGEVTLSWLSRKAPLIGKAVQRRLGGLDPATIADDETHWRWFLEEDLTLKGLRRRAPRLAEAVETALRRPDRRRAGG